VSTSESWPEEATLLVTGLIVIRSASADTPPRRIVNGWLPYWTMTQSLNSTARSADLWSSASPFWYEATGATTITRHPGADDQTVVNAYAAIAGQPIVLRWQAAGSTTWKNVATGDTSPTGAVALRHTPPSHGRFRLVSHSSWEWLRGAGTAATTRLVRWRVSGSSGLRE
jgi:hypothetical protein